MNQDVGSYQLSHISDKLLKLMFKLKAVLYSAIKSKIKNRTVATFSGEQK